MLWLRGAGFFQRQNSQSGKQVCKRAGYLPSLSQSTVCAGQCLGFQILHQGLFFLPLHFWPCEFPGALSDSSCLAREQSCTEGRRQRQPSLFSQCWTPQVQPRPRWRRRGCEREDLPPMWWGRELLALGWQIFTSFLRVPVPIDYSCISHPNSLHPHPPSSLTWRPAGQG